MSHSLTTDSVKILQIVGVELCCNVDLAEDLIQKISRRASEVFAGWVGYISFLSLERKIKSA